MKNTTTAITRPQKEKLIYRHTHRDFKGNGKILILRPGGTTLVPMTALTDDEIEGKLPWALYKEAARQNVLKAKAAKG
jgi:hypothetical protein